MIRSLPFKQVFQIQKVGSTAFLSLILVSAAFPVIAQTAAAASPFPAGAIASTPNDRPAKVQTSVQSNQPQSTTTPLPPQTLPPQLVERLFETIARDANVPANTLKVVEFQPATWNGCMGIFEPGRACTMIAISGYRVIVMGERQSWVYHLDQTGSQVVQNETASGSGNRITPSFMPPDAQPSLPAENVVFRMMVSGALGGGMTETVLTADGTLYRRTTGIPASAAEPGVIKRLSQQQLQQFEQTLQQQRFPNLNGMRYLTSAALADYPTTVVQAMGSTIAYIDLEQDSLPQSLQAVISEWNRL